eukprot:tig00020557_g11110.t1
MAEARPSDSTMRRLRAERFMQQAGQSLRFEDDASDAGGNSSRGITASELQGLFNKAREGTSMRARIEAARGAYAPPSRQATVGGPSSLGIMTRHQSLRSQFEHYEPSNDQREAAMHETWLQKRAVEAEMAKADVAMKRVLEQWNLQRARVEEEITRKQESSRFAARTPRFRLHEGGGSGLLRPQSALASASSASLAARSAFRRSQSLRPQSADPKLTENATMAQLIAAAAEDSSSEEETLPAEQEKADLAVETYESGGGQMWLSPYRNNEWKKHWKAPPFLEDEGAVRGFKSPHPETRAPAVGPKAMINAGPTPPPAPVPPVNTAIALARPSSAQLSSAYRVSQVGECEKIAFAFARRNIPCPRPLVEQAILVPCDKAYDDLVSILPRPSTGLERNPFPEDPKKGKGKAKAKGKGKKGAKKGKK